EQQTIFPQGQFEILTCKLSASDAALCDAIIADYVARNPGHVADPATKLITRDGLIGSLTLESSTEADVTGAMGTTDATSTGNYGVGLPDYKALGYDCVAQSDTRFTMHPGASTATGPYCTTLYFLNAKTHTLAGFTTVDPNYVTDKGTKVGTTRKDA